MLAAHQPSLTKAPSPPLGVPGQPHLLLSPPRFIATISFPVSLCLDWVSWNRAFVVLNCLPDPSLPSTKYAAQSDSFWRFSLSKRLDKKSDLCQLQEINLAVRIAGSSAALGSVLLLSQRHSQPPHSVTTFPHPNPQFCHLIVFWGPYMYTQSRKPILSLLCRTLKTELSEFLTFFLNQGLKGVKSSWPPQAGEGEV